MSQNITLGAPLIQTYGNDYSMAYRNSVLLVVFVQDFDQLFDSTNALKPQNQQVGESVM